MQILGALALPALFFGLIGMMWLEDKYLPAHQKEGYIPPQPETTPAESAPATVVQLAPVKEPATVTDAIPLAA